jgi:hypothetical protein
MIIRDHLSGDVHEDLAQLSKDSLDRRTESANPLEFLQWVRETLREHRQKYDELAAEHKNLVKSADSATIGLKRLESLVQYLKRDELAHLQNMHRTFIHNNRGIGYTLERCKKILDETTMTWQLVGETLVEPLADRHKKKGMQQEMGLRLKDIDAYFERCSNAVAEENQRNRQLAEGIQALMHSVKIKLPPSMQKQVDMEDQVKQLALDYSISLRKGKDLINPAKATAIEAGKIKRLGETQAPTAPPATTTPAPKTEISVSKTTSMNYIYGGLAVAAGLALGCVIFSK